MPVIGEVVTRAMADVAKSQISEVALDLRSVAKAARKEHGMLALRNVRDIQMQPLTEAQLSQAWKAITPTFIWRPDDNCGPRAYLAAHMVNRALGMGVTGVDDAVGAAVAVQSRTIRHGVGAHGGYQYHGFAVVKVEGRDGLWALDPRNFDAPVPAQMVVDKVHGRAPLEVWSPVQNTGLEITSELPALRRGTRLYNFKMHERYLKQSWDASAKAGVVLDRGQRA